MHKVLVMLAAEWPPAFTHEPLARWRRQRAPDLARQPGLRRIRLNVAREQVKREHVAGSACDIAVIEELWFDAPVADEAMANLRPSCAAWRVVQNSRVQAHTIFERPDHGAPTLRRISLLQRRPELAREAFRRYWREVHAPMAACHRFVARYEQNHVLEEEAGIFDGMAEFRITDLDRMQEDYVSEAGRAMRADVANFALSVSTWLVDVEEIAAGKP